MHRSLVSSIVASFVALAAITVLCGVAYPLAVSAVARLTMRDRAEGSLIERSGIVVGSELVGQEWTAPDRFWSRPSATAPAPYTALAADGSGASSGSNLATTNPALVERVIGRIAALAAADAAAAVVRPDGVGVPVDLVTASGSGLDPHISVAAAEYQLPRVAKATGIDENALRMLIEQNTAGRALGLFGEPGVNVLRLNLDVERASGRTR